MGALDGEALVAATEGNFVGGIGGGGEEGGVGRGGGNLWRLWLRRGEEVEVEVYGSKVEGLGERCRGAGGG